MTIRPVCTLILADGSKRKVEMYARPPTLEFEVEVDGGMVKFYFRRVGPDEYRQKIFEKEK